MNAALVALLETEAANLVRRMQWEASGEAGNTYGLDQPPHVTFKTSFPLDGSHPIAAVDALLDDIGRQTTPWDARVSPVGAFDHGVFFLDVLPSSDLIGLHRLALDETRARFGVEPGPYEGQHVRFHVSLGRACRQPSAIDRAHRAWEAAGSPVLPIRRLAAFCQHHPGSPWFVRHIVDLHPWTGPPGTI